MAVQEIIDSEATQNLVDQVASRLREARKRSGMTLADVGVKCGSTPQTIQRLETGNMTISVEWLERLCAALGIEPFELFASSDSRQAQLANSIQEAREEMAVTIVRLKGCIHAGEAFLAATDIR